MLEMTWHVCEGVFVMVAIGLSTVSVIASILVFRINQSSAAKSLPGWVYPLARLLCVPLDHQAVRSSQSSVGSCSQVSSSTSNTTDPAGGNIRTTTADGGCCAHIRPQIDSVLCELRKVTIIIMTIKRQFIKRSNVARVTTRAPYNVRCSVK